MLGLELACIYCAVDTQEIYRQHATFSRKID